MQGPVVGWVEGGEGLQLRWRRWDAAAPRASVLLVHGFGDHGGRYRDVAGVLGARGFTVAAYDQRGHGESPGRRGDVSSFESYLTDLDRVWAEAGRVLPGPLFLYGHSFGGLVVMRWVETRLTGGAAPRASGARPAAAPPVGGPPPLGVVLTAPWLALRLAVPWWKLAAARALLLLAPGLPISSGSDKPEFLTRDPERAAEYLADPLVHHRISARFHRATLAAQAAAVQDPWPAVPTLLALPGDDPLIDAGAARRWQERHPVVEFFVREGGRHELHNDVDRAQAIGRIGVWMERRLAPEPGTAERVLAPGL